MRLTIEIIFGLAGFFGWLAFFIQRRDAARLRAACEQWRGLVFEFQSKAGELVDAAASWRRVAWFGVLVLFLVFLKIWRERRKG